MTTGTGGGSSDIQAVHRVAEILRLFTVNQPQVTVSEAASQIGLNRSTTHRYFSSLLMENILERSEEEPTAFVPGRLLIQIGAFAQGQRNVLDVAPQYLRQLSRETHLTTVLSLWGESGAVVSQVCETGAHPILITVRLGSSLDLDSAQTRLFVKLLRDRDSVARYLDAAPADQRKRYDAELDTHSDRVVLRNDLIAMDSVILAAPVFGDHDIAATIALIGTTSSLATDALDKEDALLRTAAQISDRLGGLPLWEAATGGTPTDR